MPGVSVVQPVELRQPQASGTQSRGGDPFSDLLEIASNAHRDSADPSAPVSRAKARSDSLARQGAHAPVEANHPDEGLTSNAASGEIPGKDAAEAETEKPLAAGEPSPSTQATDDAATADEADADAVVEVEGMPKPEIPGSALIFEGETAPTVTSENQIQAIELAPALLATSGGGGSSIIPAAADSKSALAAILDGAPATQPPAAPDVAADLEGAQESVQTGIMPKATPPASLAPTATQATEAGTASAAALPASHNSVPAFASDVVQGPQPTPANISAPTSVGQTMPAFASDADSQSPQQQNGSPIVQSKTSEANLARPIETPASQAPALESLSRAQNNPAAQFISPEPVRALAATLNPASLQVADPNVPNPAPINGTALAVEIVSRLREGTQRFEIRLDPPELGRIDVRLDVDRNGNVTTKLTVDRPETLELMQREARGLERALQTAGLKTDAGGLEFSLRSHADNPASQGRSGSHEPQPDFLAVEESERIEVVFEGYRTAAYARGGVDIRV